MLGDEARTVVDPWPTGSGSPLRTAALAWAERSSDHSHVMVVQDDVLIPDGFFVEAERAVARFPGEAIGFYANAISWNGAGVNLAHACGYEWVTASDREYFPTLATILPAELASGFAVYASRRAEAGERDDDEVLRTYLTGEGVGGVLASPSRVQHDAGESLAGASTDVLRTAELVTKAPIRSWDVLAIAEEFATFTQMRSRLYRRRAEPGRRWAAVGRAEHLAAVGLAWAEVRELAARLAVTSGVDPDVPRARAHAYLCELALASTTLAMHVGRYNGGRSLSPQATAEAVHALIRASFGTYSARSRWGPRLAELADAAAAIVTDRTAIGKEGRQ